MAMFIYISIRYVVISLFQEAKYAGLRQLFPLRGVLRMLDKLTTDCAMNPASGAGC